MKSYRIDWRVNTTTVSSLAGCSYALARTSQRAKEIIEAYLRFNISNIESLEMGRAFNRDPEHDSAYITATTRLGE